MDLNLFYLQSVLDMLTDVEVIAATRLFCWKLGHKEVLLSLWLHSEIQFGTQTVPAVTVKRYRSTQKLDK